MTEMPVVTIIIPNWNGKGVLRECLSSLSHLDYPNLEIVVVDNGSTDGSTSMIEKEFSNVKLLINKKNLGFAGGCNIGIRAAKGDLICLFNNDAIAHPFWLYKVVEAFNSSPVGIVGCSICSSESKEVTLSAGMKIDAITGWSWQVDHGSRLGCRLEPDSIDYLTGCAMLIRREVIDKIGLLDESYFLYGEDLDLCMRARRAGYECLVVPDAVVYHSGSYTRKKIRSQGYYLQMRGNFRTYFKHFPIRYMITSLFFQLIPFPFLEMVFFKTPPVFIVLRLKAFLWNMTRLRITIVDRNKTRSMGPEVLGNRFSEFVLISRDRVTSQDYDF